MAEARLIMIRLLGAVLIGVLAGCADRASIGGSAGMAASAERHAEWPPPHAARDRVPLPSSRGTLTPNQRLLLGFLFADADPEERHAYARWAGANISGVREFADPLQHDRNSVQYQAAWLRFREETVRQGRLLQESVAEWEDVKHRLGLHGWE